MTEIVAVFSPLLAFLVAGAFILIHHPQRDTIANIVTVGAMTLSAGASCLLFYQVFHHFHDRITDLGTWFHVGTFSIDWSLRIDALSVMMLCVVTLVSLLVHIYSLGYMHHDASRARFMAYLSFFTFAMLILVTSNNLVTLFLGWEGVGVASYLLIGFWHHRVSASRAAIKAFVTNRVGDAFFMLGILGVFTCVGSLNFDAIFASLPSLTSQTVPLLGMDVSVITLLGFMFVLGAMGKSAQFGLHIWLPDAMEGPTPVSALIHAATMVTAGVFLLIRLSPLLELSETCLSFITVVGAVTALFAATVAITQNDIKRVIAFSTCSQLGYMVFAVGVSAYSLSLFHLVTHAFFKALLFLSAGSVIHALSDEQDIRRMGGLYRYIPFTYAFMWIGSLALMGVPFFAGYFSKDLILEAAAARAGWQGSMSFTVGLMTAALTAAYSIRLIHCVFHGTPRANDQVMAHIHEAPWVMIAPKALLALGALVSGYLLAPIFQNTLWWTFVIKVLPEHNHSEAMHHLPMFMRFLPLVVVAVASSLAFWVLRHYASGLEALTSRWSRLYAFSVHKWFVDEFYARVLYHPMERLAAFLADRCDRLWIDQGGPGSLARLSAFFGQRTLRFYQFGTLSSYIPQLVSGVTLLAFILILTLVLS